MATANNNKEFSRLATPAGGAIDEIKDATDNVHTGIVKALSKLASGNIPVKGFNITGTSSSQITFATGDTLVDGVKQTVSSGLTVTIDTTNTSRYTLIVANGTSLAARTHSVDNAIAPANEDDVIIGVAKNTGSDPPLFQYLTVSKDSNTVSIARDSSGYTESATIKSNSGDIEFEALEQDKDIIFKVNDGGSSTEVMRIDGANSRVGIGTASPDTALHVEGSNHIIRVKDTSAGDSALTRTMGGVELSAAGMNTSSKFGVPIKFMSTDSAFTTENPKFLAAIVPIARESYTADTKGGMAIGFATTANSAGASTVPQVNMTLDHNGRLGIGTSSPSVELDVTGQFRVSSHAELNGDLDHDGSNIGFFGTGVASRQTVGNMGGTAVTSVAPGFIDPGATQLFSPNQQAYLLGLETEIGNLRTKVDLLIDALQLYGLIL